MRVWAANKHYSHFLSRSCFLLLMLAFAVAGLNGCSTQSTDGEAESNAFDEYYEAIRAKNYNALEQHLGEDFYNRYSLEEWKNHLTRVNEVLGDLESYKIKNRAISTIYSGTRVTFQISAKYANGFAQEIIVMFKEINSDEPSKIIAHSIKSDLLR